MHALAHWKAGVEDRLIELPGEALDALGRGIERRDHRRLRRLGAIGGYGARLLEGGEFGLEPPQFFFHPRQLIGERQRGHDREPRVADLAEARAQRGDPRVELLGEMGDMRLFAVLASHPELTAVDGNIDLRHGSLSARLPRARSGSCRWQHRAARRTRDWPAPASGCAPPRAPDTPP